jgi:hypothetical protein
LSSRIRRVIITPCSFLDELTVSRPLKKFPAFYETRRLISIFTTSCHWTKSWVSSVQYTFSKSKLLTFILLLFCWTTATNRPIVHLPDENGEPWWNDTDRRKPKN